MGVMTKRRLISKAKRHAAQRGREREDERFLGGMRRRMQATVDACNFYRSIPAPLIADAE
jgi:hypothetical protein